MTAWRSEDWNLVATARAFRYVLATCDEAVPKYGARGHVRVARGGRAGSNSTPSVRTKVLKPAHAMSNIAVWPRGRCAPLEPPTSRAAAGAASEGRRLPNPVAGARLADRRTISRRGPRVEWRLRPSASGRVVYGLRERAAGRGVDLTQGSRIAAIAAGIALSTGGAGRAGPTLSPLIAATSNLLPVRAITAQSNDYCLKADEMAPRTVPSLG